MTSTRTEFRRLVVLDEPDARGETKSKVIADGTSPDVRTDPARPDLKIARMWVTDRTPARINGIRETLTALPHTLMPPPGGSLCRVVTFPPEADHAGRIGAKEVQAFFAAMDAPGISTYSAQAPHPYMQKAAVLEFALVIEGRITLVLDTEEVHLEAGDTVVQRGTNHAWANWSNAPCTIAFSAHDAFG